MNKVEIEGKVYEEVLQQSPYTGVSRKLAAMLSMGALMHDMSYGGSNYERQRPSVDLVEEFKLIQQKKSKLNRSDRDWVVSQFKKLYKEI
jgi:hypothetical protein